MVGTGQLGHGGLRRGRRDHASAPAVLVLVVLYTP
jgi:hypothetical protein